MVADRKEEKDPHIGVCAHQCQDCTMDITPCTTEVRSVCPFYRLHHIDDVEQ